MQCTKPWGNALHRCIQDHTYRGLVCSVHFSKSDYTVMSLLSTKRTLNQRAVPLACLCNMSAATIMPPFATHAEISRSAPCSLSLSSNSGRNIEPVSNSTSTVKWARTENRYVCVAIVLYQQSSDVQGCQLQSCEYHLPFWLDYYSVFVIIHIQCIYYTCQSHSITQSNSNTESRSIIHNTNI